MFPVAQLRVELRVDAQVQRHVQSVGLLGGLGLFGGDLGEDLIVPGPARGLGPIRCLGHEPNSFPSRYTRRSPPRVFPAVTPDQSSGSTITVTMKPAPGE